VPGEPTTANNYRLVANFNRNHYTKSPKMSKGKAMQREPAPKASFQLFEPVGR
jgi:hypothetical protein